MYNVELNSNKKDMTDTKIEMLQKNIMFFCNTPEGSLPQNRDFGLDPTITDEPFPRLRMRATVDIVTGVRKFYNVQLTEINITADENGNIKVKISI